MSYTYFWKQIAVASLTNLGWMKSSLNMFSLINSVRVMGNFIGCHANGHKWGYSWLKYVSLTLITHTRNHYTYVCECVRM